jgi:hypothetical protein
VEFDSGRQILFFKQNQMVSLSVEFLLEKKLQICLSASGPNS